MRQTARRDVPPLKGEIRFENLDFRYKENEPILTGFNLHIRPGETLALVGHTGAGKSSIAKLIARFYEFQGGRLLIDGHDIRTFDLQQYRRQLGIVSQVLFLFSGTVAENIRYAVPSASDAEILAVARQVGDGEWLETLPQGLETQVGERGSRLAMGQRQLVALMRVLVQKPAIFILDEATASVDPFTEWQIQQALDLILHQSTSILIAHRLSTVKAADRIVVMRQGAITEEGTHDGLLAQGRALRRTLQHLLPSPIAQLPPRLGGDQTRQRAGFIGLIAKSSTCSIIQRNFGTEDVGYGNPLGHFRCSAGGVDCTSRCSNCACVSPDTLVLYETKARHWLARGVVLPASFQPAAQARPCTPFNCTSKAWQPATWGWWSNWLARWRPRWIT